MRAATLALVAALLPAAAGAEPYDIPWFQANPQEQARVLRACQDDHRKINSPICQNARAARARGMGRPLGPPPADPWYTPRPGPLRMTAN